MYRTTSKSLDKRLSKEEQLVYLKCFVPKSLGDLRRITSLEEKTLESALTNLMALGFLRELTNAVASSVNPKATLTPETLGEDVLARSQRKLTEELGRLLGLQAQAFQREVDRTQSIAELKGIARKILVKLRLTISQSVAKDFEAATQKIFVDV